MKIKVTEDDIRQGWVASFLKCPVARALKRTTNKEIRVSGRLTWEDNNGEIYTAKLPKGVGEFMDDFDAFKPVAPFEFDFFFEDGRNDY